MNPEQYVLHLNHGYEVEAGDGITRSGRDSAQASHGESGDRETLSGQEGQILTIIETVDQTECAVGGRSRWTQADVSDGVFGTLEEWMACGGFALDDTSSQAASGLPTESGDPRLRISGAVLQLDMYYYDKNSEQHREDWKGVVCYIRVRVIPKWNIWTEMAYSLVPDLHTSPNPPIASAYRSRRNYGVSLAIQAKGSMFFFSYSDFITNIVNALVLLSLPGPIISFICLYLMGLISKIYMRVHMQTLDLRMVVAGTMTRLVGAGQVFRSLTDQKGAESGGMKLSELEGRIREVLARSIDSGELQEKEIQSLVAIVERRLLGEGGDNTIELQEFLDTYSQNETIPLVDLETLLDLDRKKCPLEMLLTDSKFGVGQQAPLLKKEEDPVSQSEPNDSEEKQPVQI
jgi:hypothetical protein